MGDPLRQACGRYLPASLGTEQTGLSLLLAGTVVRGHLLSPEAYEAYVREIVRVMSQGFATVAQVHVSRLDDTRRNEEARAAAVASMIGTIEQTYRSLADAGKPGLGPVAPASRHREWISGWRVIVDWTSLTLPVPAITPPPMTNRIGQSTPPRENRQEGFGHVALTEDGNVACFLATVALLLAGKDPAEYAVWMLQDWMTWWSPSYEAETHQLAAYTEPDEYLPYVQAVAAIVNSAFSAIRFPATE